jgi:hypothetical protein
MPDDRLVGVVTVTPEGLGVLFGRLARLQLSLEQIAVERDQLKVDNADLATWFAACRQLEAVLEFVEDSEELMPELHKLLYAIIDLREGLKVAWLEPFVKGRQRGQPKGFETASIHARLAAGMNWLMEDGGKKKEEAARFVVEHGGLRRWLQHRGRANSDWKTVANWRDRIKVAPSAAERVAWDATYEIIDDRGRTGGDIEAKAKKLLRGIRIYFGLNQSSAR